MLINIHQNGIFPVTEEVVSGYGMSEGASEVKYSFTVNYEWREAVYKAVTGKTEKRLKREPTGQGHTICRKYRIATRRVEPTSYRSSCL